MGQNSSKIDVTHNPRHEERCNYYCPNCRKTNKLPNIAGRFYDINETECQCNACFSIYDKKILSVIRMKMQQNDLEYV
jgi:hypothetical protein